MAIQFLTGQRLTADLLNTNVVPPDAAFATQATDETAFTSTTYTNGTNVCGTSFVAPPNGIVLVLWAARFQSNVTTTNARVLVTVSVATGSVVGSGSVVSAATDESALESTVADTANTGHSRFQGGTFRVVSGLTGGSTYNVVTQHKMAVAGNGTIFQRDVLVIPLF